MKCAKCGSEISAPKCPGCGFDHSAANICFLSPQQTVALQMIQESADEQYQKGMYFHWQGNDAEAVVWLRKAAEQGHAAAQNALGVCYVHGYAVPVDRDEAAVWFSKAAAQGMIVAFYNMVEYVIQFDNDSERRLNRMAIWINKRHECEEYERMLIEAQNGRSV